jgi:gas vesicle protein
MAKGTAKKFAIGTILAAVAGYLAGILTAPKSGKETRKDIKETADKTVSQAEQKLKKLHTQMEELMVEAKKRLSSISGKSKDELTAAIDLTKTAKEKARQLLSAVHEGETEDRDLQKAIDEAQQAVDHLKNYLKKSA